MKDRLLKASKDKYNFKPAEAVLAFVRLAAGRSSSSVLHLRLPFRLGYFQLEPAARCRRFVLLLHCSEHGIELEPSFLLHLFEETRRFAAARRLRTSSVRIRRISSNLNYKLFLTYLFD